MSVCSTIDEEAAAEEEQKGGGGGGESKWRLKAVLVICSLRIGSGVLCMKELLYLYHTLSVNRLHNYTFIRASSSYFRLQVI
jgi:hypothetical protein